MPLDIGFWDAEREALEIAIKPILEDIFIAGVVEGFVDTVGPDFREVIDWAFIQPQIVTALENYSFTLVSGITQTTQTYLQVTMSNWIQSGAPISELIETLTNSGFWGAVRSEMIAVTETTRAFAQGNLEAWRQGGVVSGKDWVTAFDDFVCPICEPLHEKVVSLEGLFQSPELSDSVEAPPAHIRCRCYIRPIVVEV